MSLIHQIVIRFKQSDSADAVKNRVRIFSPGTDLKAAIAYQTPFDELDKPTPDADGFSRIPLVNVPKAAGLTGTFELGITAIDATGNESDFLEIDNAVFDLSPPDAPTDGSLE